MSTETLDPENSHQPPNHKAQVMYLEVQVKQKTRKKKGGAFKYKEKPAEAPAEAQVFLDLQLERVRESSESDLELWSLASVFRGHALLDTSEFDVETASHEAGTKLARNVDKEEIQESAHHEGLRSTPSTHVKTTGIVAQDWNPTSMSPV